MDFLDGLPRSPIDIKSIWVVVDQLKKLTYVIHIPTAKDAEYLARKYVQQIVRLHGVHRHIVSNRDTIFSLTLWRSL